ncbi:hypothetical protein ACLMJK_009743 [Lecanora helva]
MERTYEIPCPPFDLGLSVWDKRFAPLYSKRVLCFALPENNKESNAKITQLLVEALRNTVEELPFLAGSIVRPNKAIPWLHDIRAEGATRLEVRDYTQEISFADLHKDHFPSASLNSQKLCPFPRAVYNRDEDHPADVCRLRANFVDGGLLLVISIVHTVCDGSAITAVLELFADKFRKAQTGELAPHATSNGHTAKPIYVFNRTSVMHGNGGQGAIENNPWVATTPVKRPLFFPDTKTICTNFYISKESLIRLKNAASPPLSTPPTTNGHHVSDSQATVPYISTLDAVSALIWRSIMLARHHAGIIPWEKPTNLICPVDMRSRLDLPVPYYGNAVTGHMSTLSPAELGTPSGLKTAATAIRTGITNSTPDRFRDLLDLTKRVSSHSYVRMSLVEDLMGSGMFMTSYWGYKMHELDFGEALGGRMEAFRLPSAGLIPGMPVVLPRLLDGGCEVVVSEGEEVMRALEGDEVWRGFVGREGQGVA